MRLPRSSIFDTALRLLGFGRFRAETIDIALQMGPRALLLALIHRLLLRKAGCALHFLKEL